MMLVRQVLCRQAIFRQVCMTALKSEIKSVGQILQVNIRFGRLLHEERVQARRSVRTIARKLKIRREVLRKWELGKASPPARTFIAIIRIYGPEAMFRAAELDLQIQFERYALVKEMIEKGLHTYSCASKFTHSLAA